MPKNSRMAVPDLTYANAPCHRPVIRMLIQYDGEVCNCCEDTFGAFKLGNVYEQSLEQLWFSDRHSKIIGDLIAGRREQYGLCRNCPLPPTGPASTGKRIEFFPRADREHGTIGHETLPLKLDQ